MVQALAPVLEWALAQVEEWALAPVEEWALAQAAGGESKGETLTQRRDHH